MGKNKQQASTEARAKKATTAEQPAEQPKPEVKPTATPAPATQPNKHQLAIERLKEGWIAKGINLDQLTITPDGKYTYLVVAPGWPRVRVGATGGLEVSDLKSYSSAFDAAMDGLALYQKQQAREQKKATATAPAAQPAAVKQSASA